MPNRVARRNILRIAATVPVLGLMSAKARAKETVTFGYLLDASHEAVLYAIKSGRVTSSVIDVELHALAIPALIQATSARQYDVIETATLAIPRAALQGLSMVILSTAQRFRENTQDDDIWVGTTSPIHTVADLRGKTLGVAAINSTGAALVRFALWKKYGLNVQLEGGDVHFVELPPPALMTALAAGKIDAASQIAAQTYQGVKEDAIRSIARVGNDLHDLYGVYMVPAVNASYPDKLAARPQAFEEFSRMLKASADYAREHIDEVAAAVSPDTGQEPGYFKWWNECDAEFPATVSDADIKAIGKTFELAKELGVLQSYPDPSTLVWEHALRA
jgi:NitT/TauT family transport system substrate-binding protein